MYIRQLKPREYERLSRILEQKAHAEPLDASYKVDMNVNGKEYVLKVQPENNKIVALQALGVFRDENGPNFDLITENCLLSSLLEIMIYQGV